LDAVEILLASNNPDKKTEFTAILFPHRILLPSEIGLEFDFEETGTSYFENAHGKGLHLYKQVQRTVLADDSGLSVPALQGAPGIYSSRYGSLSGSGKLDPAERNEFLLEKMKNISNREAFFVCCLVFLISDYQFIAVQETLEGEIGKNQVGSGGFGYDPVFVLPSRGKTLAELTPAEKHEISHRGKAGHRLLAFLETT
jgi:XTP/dITP diphosphohydrolase